MEKTLKKIEWFIMRNNISRWLLFLPISILSSFIVSFLVQLIINIAFSYYGIYDDAKLFRYIIEGFFCGFTLMYVAGYIAPNKIGKIIILLILLSLCVIQIISIFINNNNDYMLLLYGALLLLGAYIANKLLTIE